MKNVFEAFSSLFVVAVKVEDVSHDVSDALIGEELQMLDDVDDFASRIRIVDLTFVGHRAQFAEGFDEAPQSRLGHVGPVLLQHGHFRGQVGVVDRVAGEQIAESAEKVVSEEGKSGSIGQNHHSEIRMHYDEIVLFADLASI